MKNEEILEAARKNKADGEEYEKKVLIRSNLLALAITFLLVMVLCLVKYFATNIIDVELIAVGTCANGVQSLYEGIKLHKWYYIMGGIFLLLVCIFAVILFIGKMVLE